MPDRDVEYNIYVPHDLLSDYCNHLDLVEISPCPVIILREHWILLKLVKTSNRCIQEPLQRTGQLSYVEYPINGLNGHICILKHTCHMEG